MNSERKGFQTTAVTALPTMSGAEGLRLLDDLGAVLDGGHLPGDARVRGVVEAGDGRGGVVALTRAAWADVVKAATASVGVLLLKARPAVARPTKEWLPLAPSWEFWMRVQVRPLSAERSRPSP